MTVAKKARRNDRKNEYAKKQTLRAKIPDMTKNKNKINENKLNDEQHPNTKPKHLP